MGSIDNQNGVLRCLSLHKDDIGEGLPSTHHIDLGGVVVALKATFAPVEIGTSTVVLESSVRSKQRDTVEEDDEDDTFQVDSFPTDGSAKEEHERLQSLMREAHLQRNKLQQTNSM